MGDEQSLVIDANCKVAIVDKLMDGEYGIIRLVKKPSISNGQ